MRAVQAMSYPFTPKSNRKLEAGQFWSIDLISGGWACGRVLGLHHGRELGKTVSFIGAILEWRGDERPTCDAIRGRTGYFGSYWSLHVRNITDPGGTIDGWCELGRPDLPVLRTLGRLYDAGTYLRDHAPDEQGRFKPLGSLNLGAIWRLANEWVGGVDEEEAAAEYRARFEPSEDS